MFRWTVLNCAHASRLFGVHPSPVLVAELDATVRAQADREKEEDSPDAGDDQANGKESERCAGHDERSG